MELCSALTAALCFALACNLDTVLLAAACGSRGTAIPPGPSLVLAGVTTMITAVSLVLGDAVSGAFPAGTAERLGAVSLVCIGGWFLLDGMRTRDKDPGAERAAPGIAGWISLAAALAVNNAGAGMAAGAAGLSPAAAAAGNFAVTLAALPLGQRLGMGAAGRRLGQYAQPLSGALLAVLGAWRLLI